MKFTELPNLDKMPSQTLVLKVCAEKFFSEVEKNIEKLTYCTNTKLKS